MLFPLLLLLGVVTAQETGSADPSCDPGYVLDGSECVPCDAGHYWLNNTTPICLECFAGRYSVGQAVTVCTRCAVGTYANVSGSTECLPCEPGTYAAYQGTINCSVCAYDTVSPGLVECPGPTVGSIWGLYGSLIALFGSLTLYACYDACKLKQNGERQGCDAFRIFEIFCFCWLCCPR